VSLDWDNSATSFGYWLGEEFRSRGTMTEAVRALTDHALRVWELNRVQIRVASDNRRSPAIPERIGFREEGILRQAQRIGDRVFDLAVYSMLAEESPGRN
jgi:ribosomal-protein-serine acetyltransferase